MVAGKRWKIILLSALAMLIANAVFAADGDERFHGGSYDGYAQDSVLDAPITLPAGTIFKVVNRIVKTPFLKIKARNAKQETQTL